jgi:GT2 family glycosyltransferase
VASLSIAAVVVSHGASDYLERTLENVAKQSYPLEQVVVVDTLGDEKILELSRKHNFAAIQPDDLGLGAAINAGINALGSRPNWLWILHDDSAPESDALKQLAKAAEISPSVAMIGPKLLSWDKPIEIQQMGLTLTRSGRPFLQVEREYDQGQHDTSADTLSVSTAGLLISLGLWEKLGGLDDSSPVFAQDIELGMRARAAGFRVIIEASARVHHAGLAMAGQRSRKWVGGTRRQGLSKAHLHLATTLLPLPLVIMLYLALPLVAIASIPVNLIAKNPGRSLGQISGWLWAWFTFPKRFAARARTRSFGSLAGLRTLLARPEQIRKRKNRELAVEVEPKNPVRGLFASGAVLAALIPLALAVPRFPQGAIQSENLVPLGRSFSDIWATVSSAMLHHLDGVTAQSDPFNWFFALIALFSPASPSFGLAVFVFVAPALIFMGSWLLLGLATQRAWLRTAAALLFSLSPQVQQLADAAAVVELASLIGFVWVIYFLNQSVTAFNAARSWRWMSLAGFAAALVAISSPLAFALLLPVAIWIGAARPKRLAITLWFLIPGLALLAPWLLAGLSVESVITSSARIPFSQPDLSQWIVLGIATVLTAAGFAVGRGILLSGLLLAAAAILLITRVDIFASLGELWALLLLTAIVGATEFLGGLPRRSAMALGGATLAGALASGVIFSALSAPKYEFVSDRQLPALVVALADVDPGTRTLVIDLAETATADLVWGDGRSQEEIALRYAPDSSSQFRVLLAMLTGSLLAGNPSGVGEILTSTSVDFVLLRGDDAQLSAARVAVASTALFQESGETEYGVLFRVLEPNSLNLVASHPYRQSQLAALAAFLLLTLPTPATIRGYRRVRGGT